MNRTHFDEVLELLARYYDGLYNLDAEALRGVFSTTASYATIAAGTPLALPIDEYLPRLAKRTAPADEGVPYAYRVTSIRFAGENTALAEVESSMFGHDYSDLLSLLRIDGAWRVQAKVFEGTPQPQPERA